MARVGEENGLSYEGDQVYTEDGTVDLKGRPVFRSKTGRWKACSFIVGNVFPFINSISKVLLIYIYIYLRFSVYIRLFGCSV